MEAPRIILANFMLATPAWAADVQELQIDSMRLSISYAEFIKARPAARGQNNWYMYSPEPEDKKELGFPVRKMAKTTLTKQGE